MNLDRILIIDDDGNVRSVLADLFGEMDLSILAVTSLKQARDVLQNESFDAVFCDVRLSDGNGLEFLQQLKERNPKQKMVIMTGFASMDIAMQAIHVGVIDFLIKPIDPSLLQATVQRLQTLFKLEEENSYLRQETTRSHEDMQWGESGGMQSVKEMVTRVGETEATVLIQGESGVGKEMISRALHIASPRAVESYIRVNCAAIPANLMESEFFGHEKGAFTGAVQRRIGRFELADKGTLLLDEITEISLELQVKLLRVLQEREFERVGGNKTIRVDVRIIATTNRNLASEVAAGRFREDLYYRLNVFPIVVPPLRQRGNDLLLLAQNFLQRFAKRHGKGVTGFAEYAQSKMLAYSWPGNVRELQNVVERGVILGGDKRLLETSDLSLADVPVTKNGTEKILEQPQQVLKPMAEVEQEMIRLALKQCKGNKTKAAAALGISLRTMQNRLTEYRAAGIEVE